MLNKFSRFILTASSVSPVCGTVAFLIWVKKDNSWNFFENLFSWKLNNNELLFFISIALVLIFSLLFPIIFFYAKKEERWNHPTEIKITAIRSKNNEMTSYLLGYLFPLIAGGGIYFQILK